MCIRDRNEGTIPSLPVIIQLVKICGLPMERYFNPEVMREEKMCIRDRSCLVHKIAVYKLLVLFLRHIQIGRAHV